jgi:hypothetical protein
MARGEACPTSHSKLDSKRGRKEAARGATNGRVGLSFPQHRTAQGRFAAGPWRSARPLGYPPGRTGSAFWGRQTQLTHQREWK